MGHSILRLEGGGLYHQRLIGLNNFSCPNTLRAITIRLLPYLHICGILWVNVILHAAPSDTRNIRIRGIRTDRCNRSYSSG